MMFTRNERLKRLLPFMVAAGCVLVGSRGWGATPESPETKEMVGRGYRFLESVNQVHSEWGGDCLMGLTFVKKGAGESHPAVWRAVNRVQQVLSQPNVPTSSAYSVALAGVFLCELDAQKYRPEIDALLKHLIRIQRPEGAWGYSHYTTGDTSQTQYGVLCLLTAQRAGVPVPRERVELAAAWLCRTQDVGGGWGYQGQDASGGQRVAQSGVSLSMSAAGAGSVLICGHILGVTSAAQERTTNSRDLPLGLTLVPEHAERPADGKKLSGQEAEVIRRAATDANRWFDRNYQIEYPTYQHYYLYALERYMAFREMAAQRDEKEPQWYNDGVAFLRKTQAADGSWTGGCGPAVDTCFAILFLTRSTKKSPPQPSEGTLVGGKGLGVNLNHVKVVNNRIVADQSPDEINRLIAAGNFEALVDLPDALPLETNPQKLATQLLQLRRLVEAENFKVRLLAVKTLGKTDDYDCIPHLIYALTDANWQVTRAAHDSLRHITRSFDGALLPDQPNESQRQVAISRWKQWYTSVNPNAAFLERRTAAGK